MTPETAAPTPPADAAPTELQGRWNVHLGLGDDATLTIRETTYQIKHGGHLGAGNVSVDGNVITFKESSICPDGVGTYLWAINNGTLTFTPTGTPDPCGRTLELVGTTFTRAAG